MKLSFIVPLHNCLALTQAMLESLRQTVPASLGHEIVFVDDHSTDGTGAWLAGLPSPCRSVRNEKNLGFAATCNRGAGLATGEYLVFLNNDLVLLPGWIEPMLAAIQAHRDFGALGNLQVRFDNGTLDHAGLLVTPEGKIAHDRVRPRDGNPRRVIEVPGVTAACLLVRRSEFEAAGRFDEAFVNGGEDIDLCFRLRRQGLRSGVVPASVIRHHVSAARGPTSARDERNSRLLVQRWHDELVHWGALTWARHQVRSRLGQPWGREGWRAVTALPFVSGLSRTPPRFARRLLTSALHRETVRWHRMFDVPAGTPPAPRDGQAYWEERFFRDDIETESAWLRDRATLHFPAGFPAQGILASGFLLPVPVDRPFTDRPVGFRMVINHEQRLDFPALPLGNFNLGTDAPMVQPGEPTRVDLELLGVGRGNFLAWASRITKGFPFPRRFRRWLDRYRYQSLNRRLRFVRVVCDDEVIFDFKRTPALHRNLRNPIKPTGVNLIGWFRAAVGIGESVRCMARACDGAKLPATLINLRLHCLNQQADDSFTSRLEENPRHQINVFHIDPPVSDQIDHHHGPQLRRDRYNIAYWAWELPVFPRHWVRQAANFDEIWCPSEFVRASIAAQTDLPVRVMPHAIDFPLPAGDGRGRFGLPRDRFLFLFAYDLNSYQERKNPLAVIAAYRRAFPDEQGVGLVIKTQNPVRNPATHAQLVEALRGLRQVTLIDETLSRPDILLLQQSCDCFVSLHRAEGFGLAVAESMFLGKAVIATDWSATAEYLDASNGLPVPWNLVELRESHGPYEAGQKWADPDIGRAAEMMRRLVDEPGLAGRLGAAAAKTIRERFSPERVGALYRERLETLFPRGPGG